MGSGKTTFKFHVLVFMLENCCKIISTTFTPVNCIRIDHLLFFCLSMQKSCGRKLSLLSARFCKYNWLRCRRFLRKIA